MEQVNKQKREQKKLQEKNAENGAEKIAGKEAGKVAVKWTGSSRSKKTGVKEVRFGENNCKTYYMAFMGDERLLEV